MARRIREDGPATPAAAHEDPNGLLAAIAHELRNPIFAISATLDAFEARFGPVEEHRRYLAVLRDQVERLSRLARDLQEYRPASAEDFHDGSLAEALNDAVAACRPAVERAGLRMDVRIDPLLPPLRLDYVRLARALMLVLERAIHRGKRGETIRVCAHRAFGRRSPRVLVAVLDRGAPLGDEDLRRVFEPFASAADAPRGLGLALTRRVVAAHGGDIVVRNRPRGGIAVIVHLPLSRTNAKESCPSDEQHPARG